MPTLTAEVNLTDEQLAAVEHLLAFSKSVQTLAGYAGVGKTTVIKEIKRNLPRFAVCAFTGKAANVLRRKGVPASTIHSLIYGAYEWDDWEDLDERGRPKRKVAFDLKPPEKVDCDGFIVDEGSMIGKTLHDAIMSFGRPIIYVGDHGQLEPVADQGFNLMADPDVKLETIHRNAGEIARFAEHLRKGLPASEWRASGKKVRIVGLDEGRNWRGDQIICAFNRTRVALNRQNREALGMPPDEPVVGDRVMCLQNDRTLGVFNGMQGTIAAIDGERMTFAAEDKEFKVRCIPEQFNQERKPEARDRDKRLPFDYCYAVTAHKFQGDQADRVLVLEQRCGAWSHERWCYTAASRAVKQLTWITGADHA